MKKCVTCGETKAVTEFSFRNKSLGRRWGTCKSCQRKQQKRWYARNKDVHKQNSYANKKKAIADAQRFVWDYLSEHPCVDCGESDPIVLEFDHVKGRKKWAVADMVRQGYSIRAIESEIAKCAIRCANCHRRKTHQERGWWRGGTPSSDEV